MKKPIRLAIDVEREDIETLKKIAAKRGVSLAQPVRQTLRGLVERTR